MKRKGLRISENRQFSGGAGFGTFPILLAPIFPSSVCRQTFLMLVRVVVLDNVYSFQILLLPAFRGQLPKTKLIVTGLWGL